MAATVDGSPEQFRGDGVAEAVGGRRGRCRGGEAAATATAAQTGSVDRYRGHIADATRTHRRRSHSRLRVWDRNGGGDFHEGAARTPGSAAIFATGISTTGAVPRDTGNHAINIESTVTGSTSGTFAMLAAEQDIVRTFGENDVAVDNAEI